MLKKKQRVSKELFKEVFKKSKTLSSNHLSFRFYRETAVFRSKFSFIVSKNISKKATIRNLLKRRGYSIIKQNLKKIKNSYIGFFSFKKGAEILPFGQIKAEVEALLRKSQIKVD